MPRQKRTKHNEKPASSIAREAGQQRLIPVSSADDADEVQGRLTPGDGALIVITGVPRAL